MVDRDCFVTAPFAGHYEPIVHCGEAVTNGQLVGWLHDFDRFDLKPHPIRSAVDGVIIAHAWTAAVPQGQHVLVVGKEQDWESA